MKTSVRFGGLIPVLLGLAALALGAMPASAIPDLPLDYPTPGQLVSYQETDWFHMPVPAGQRVFLCLQGPPENDYMYIRVHLDTMDGTVIGSASGWRDKWIDLAAAGYDRDLYVEVYGDSALTYPIDYCLTANTTIADLPLDAPTSAELARYEETDWYHMAVPTGQRVFLCLQGPPQNDYMYIRVHLDTLNGTVIGSASGWTDKWIDLAAVGYDRDLYVEVYGDSALTYPVNCTLTAYSDPDYGLLAFGSLAPASGHTATLFTWRVQYWDLAGGLPDAVYVAIKRGTEAPSWRLMQAEDPADTTTSDGKWYTYSSMLVEGSYWHRFAAKIGTGWVYWPKPGGTYLPGPTVANPASLSSGYVTPASGDTTTLFAWRVKYWNTQNVPPTMVWLGIQSKATLSTTWRQMWALDPGDTNHVDGKWYTYACYLQAGEYDYRFAAQVGAQWLYWPQPPGSWKPGPVVTCACVLSSGYVTPASGTSATNFTWRVKYWSPCNLPPDEVCVAIWFPTLKKTYWYAMWAYEPADTNYQDGKWYTFTRRWLPPGAYSYRFAARQGTNWAYWPTPVGSYASGPLVGP